jgi:hypothetical protein
MYLGSCTSKGLEADFKKLDKMDIRQFGILGSHITIGRLVRAAVTT